MDDVKIPHKIFASYLDSYKTVIGRESLNVLIHLGSSIVFPDDNSKGRKLVALMDDPDHLIFQANETYDRRNLRILSRGLLEVSGSRKNVRHSSRRIGWDWWRPEGDILWASYWNRGRLSTIAEPTIRQALQSHFRIPKNENNGSDFITPLFIAAKALSIVLSYKAFIKCYATHAGNEVIFHVVDNPYCAEDVNDDFLLVWGIIDEFGRWLTDYKTPEIDEERSTATRICIKRPE